jgi:hypothetical protein
LRVMVSVLDFAIHYAEQSLPFAILRLVASLAPESGLLGDSVKDAAQVDQWIHFVEHEISAYTDLIWQMLMGFFAEKTYSEQVSRPL